MNLKKIPTSLIILLIIVFSTSACFDNRTAVEKLQWVESADPITDANIALDSGDPLLYAVNSAPFHSGFSREAINFIKIPGVQRSKQEFYKYNSNYEIMEGTTDALENREHERLVELAHEYSEKYNSIILKEHYQYTESPEPEIHRASDIECKPVNESS